MPNIPTSITPNRTKPQIPLITKRPRLTHQPLAFSVNIRTRCEFDRPAVSKMQILGLKRIAFWDNGRLQAEIFDSRKRTSKYLADGKDQMKRKNRKEQK